jgi:protein-tyrosine phosphatase
MVTRIDERLFLGDGLDAKLLQSENPLNIKAVVNVENDPDEPVDGINNVHVPMMDDGSVPAEAFDVALNAVAEYLRSGPVLVHCTMGASRSVVVVALHLALTKEISLETALLRVKNLRVQADPASETVECGKRYLGQRNHQEASAPLFTSPYRIGTY